MTEKEAISKIKDIMCCDFDIDGCYSCEIEKCDNREAYMMAIKALESRIVRTNADRIRNMTNEELEKLVDTINYCCTLFGRENVLELLLQWLNKEVEE